jgi:hypothetical protein
MKRLGCILASLSVLFCIGCSKTGGSATSVDDKSSGAQSPDDAYKAWTEAAGKEDFKTFASLLTRGSQSAVAGKLMMEMNTILRVNEHAHDLAAHDQVAITKTLLKRHGLNEDTIDKEATSAGEAPDNKAAAKKIIVMGEMAKDRIVFIDDTLKVMKRIVTQGKNPLEGTSTGKLKDVKVDGDTATGKVTETIAGADKTDTVWFRKEDGAWKIDLIPELEEKGVKAFSN